MLFEVFEKAPSVTSSLVSVVASVVVVLFIRWLWISLRTPGPWGVPILGYYPFLRKDFHVQLHELSKKHGETYIINIAGQSFLYLGTYKGLKEAHVNKIEDFPSRGHKHSVLQHPLENGLAFLEGDQWRLQRKFFVQSMREVGLSSNKQELQGPIEESVHATLEALHKSKGEVVNGSTLMYKECCNVVLRLMLGDGLSEEMVTKLNDAYLKILTPMTGMNFLFVGPISKYLILPRVQGYNEMIVATKEMTEMLHRILDDHKKTFDLNQPPRDFIDLYLRERAMREKKGDHQAKHFSDTSLIASLIQFYGDGSVSVGVFVAIYLSWLSKHPEEQNAIYEEIIKVVGTERLPTWDDKANLPLTQSAMKEVLRSSDSSMVFADMECIRDTTVLGTPVAKGTLTLMNISAIHKDPEVYENADAVDITRFLPEKGKVESPVMFGIGKRACAGESLVMTEIFSFVTAIVQNFVLEPEKEGLPFLEGDQWRVQRKFFVQSMREVGLSHNKHELQGPIEESVLATLEALHKSKGEVVNGSTLMYKECSNVVLRVLLGDGLSEETVKKLNDAYLKILTPMTGMNFALVGPISKYFLLPRAQGYNEMIVATKVMKEMLHQILDDHKKTFDLNQPPRDLIDLYLRERTMREKKGDHQAKHFSDTSLIASLIQSYGDGSLSVGSFVWMYLSWLRQHPEEQNAIYEEIIRVVGTERLPTWDDKADLPLTQSALKEVLRTSEIAFVFPDMECIRDTTVLGTPVSKGTITLTNFTAIHKDPEVYENADKVDITRFLPEKGKVESPITFGIGKRACAGESLVMREIFLFVTAIVQNFLIEQKKEEVQEPTIFHMDVMIKAIPRPKGRYGSHVDPPSAEK